MTAMRLPTRSRAACRSRSPRGGGWAEAILDWPQVAGLPWRHSAGSLEGVVGDAPVSGLALVGRAGVLVYCLAFPFTEVTNAVAGMTGWAMRPAGWVLLGTAAYTPLYLRHVWCFLRGRAAPHAAWSLAALAVIMAGFTPLGQAYWIKAYATLAVVLLIAAPWRWSLPGLAILTAVQVPLGAAFGPAISIPFGGIFYPATLLWRTSAVFVPLWLFKALRQLQAARAELAQDAVLQERLRLEDRLRATVGTALAAIVARGQRAVVAVRACPESAAPKVAELTRLSRRTLADARRVLRGLHQPSARSELSAAADLLTAAGFPTQVIAPGPAQLGQLNPAFRAELHAAVAQLLRDEPSGTCVLRVTGTGPGLSLSVEASAGPGPGPHRGASPPPRPSGRSVSPDALAVPAPAQSGDLPAWAARRAMWFVIGVHLPFIVITPLNTMSRVPGAGVGELALIAAGGLAAGGLQLRHSLAAARGTRPRGWPLTLAALTAVCLIPDAWVADDWLNMIWFVIASALMLLPRRLAVMVAAAGVAGGAALWRLSYGVYTPSGTPDWRWALSLPYIVTIFVLGSTALYGSARLAAIITEVLAARTQLAEQAMTRERLRIARDLHDLLGQSLSAVSLKGDLALALLATDPSATSREIESLVGVARAALRDMRAVTRGEHDVSLAAETGTATAVLRAAGVTVTADAALPGLTRAQDTVLAWAVREGTANILRHSTATEVHITAGRAGDSLRLDITSDGARRPAGGPGTGTGLAGLASRANAAGGIAAGEYLGGGTFRLRVDLPAGEA